MSDSESESQELVLTRRELLSMTLLVEGGMFGVALLVGWWLGLRFWNEMPPTIATVVIGCLAAIPPLVIVLGITESNTRLGEQARSDFGPVITMFKNATVLDIVLVSFMAGLAEEALFRGVLQGWIETHLGLWPALTIASVIFGLAHFISWSYFAFATIIGAYLGVLWMWTGNLLAPMIAHGLYDFVALVYGTRFSKTLQDVGISSE
jgi:uncharacterized protein